MVNYKIKVYAYFETSSELVGESLGETTFMPIPSTSLHSKQSNSSKSSWNLKQNELCYLKARFCHFNLNTCINLFTSCIENLFYLCCRAAFSTSHISCSRNCTHSVFERASAPWLCNWISEPYNFTTASRSLTNSLY